MRDDEFNCLLAYLFRFHFDGCRASVGEQGRYQDIAEEKHECWWQVYPWYRNGNENDGFWSKP